MAEDVLEQCFERNLLASRPAGITVSLKLVGAGSLVRGQRSVCEPPGLHSYGDEQSLVGTLPGSEAMICDGLTEAMVRFAARFEYAIHVEDVLARRSRLLFLDAGLAGTLAEQVGGILQSETGLDPRVRDFVELARHYQYLP
jgi:glycerol-3-phosphate dehydrogenase